MAKKAVVKQKIQRKKTGNGSVEGFSNKFEYTGEYFRICELFMQKDLILKKFSDYTAREKQRTEKDTSALRGKMKSLDRKIRRMERRFWENVSESLKKGKKYKMEEYFSKKGLDHFEKKILLFLIYAAWETDNDPAYPIFRIVRILDTNNSLADQLKSIEYFNENARLLEHNIISLCNDYYRKNCCRLTNKALKYFLRLLNRDITGTTQTLDEQLEQDGETLGSEAKPEETAVGFLKEAEYSLDDVILPDETKEKILYLLGVCNNNAFEDLGINKKIKKGTGTSFLFYGPPGTGKSMLADAIGAYVQKKILFVEFPKITSKFFGETDKQISGIFKTARTRDAIVVLDEADTLLYNRQYAQWEHDIRFVNIMLQELERFEGVVILTTNMEVLLDPALERRIALKVKFEIPDKEMRCKIWKSHIPEKLELAGDIDFSYLAEKYEFSGGDIKNSVLNAVRRASCEKRLILTVDDLVFGARLEEEGMLTKKRNKVIMGFAQKFKST